MAERRPPSMIGLRRVVPGTMTSIVLASLSCTPAELSVFSEGTLLSGRVVENSTACVVDAVCFLRIELADTAVVAIYGTGERPASSCEITREVSDAAFSVQAGDVVRVELFTCGTDGLYLRRLALGGVEETGGRSQHP